MLDKGQREDWFASNLIWGAAIVSAVAIAVFIFWEWRQKFPIVELRLFKHPNFRTSAILMLTLGAVLFGTTVAPI